MSIEAFFLSYLRLLAVRHQWDQVEKAAVAVDEAMQTQDKYRFNQALGRLESTLFVNPPAGPTQALRQAREHYKVVSRFVAGASAATAAA